MSNSTNILLRHGYIEIPIGSSETSAEDLATVLMNLSHYGYALNVGAYRALTHLSSDQIANWWTDVEKELASITGDDRKIADFVVYKNFPAEVLDKSAAEYWIPQILMYWGFPSVFFTEEVVPREKMKDQPRAKVLKRSNGNTLSEILLSHLQSPARWKPVELEDACWLANRYPADLSKVVFKENMVSLATVFMATETPINIATATDVLRLAAGLSDGDVSLREKVKFISFKKPVRRFLLSMLEKCDHLSEDVARRPELWKRLFHQLHPADFKITVESMRGDRYARVVAVMDDLYHDRLVTFNGQVEALLLGKNPEVLDLLSTRPGEFRRRLVHTLDLFGDRAAKAFASEKVVDKLTTHQVVGLRTYLETVNTRAQRTFPPKGNWNKLQLGEARWVEDRHSDLICSALGGVLQKRLPKVSMLDEKTKMIKLPSNGGEVSPFTRGTVFPIPEEVDFIRTASYWKSTGHGTVWFDNGWNFFDKDWKDMGSCCWNAAAYPTHHNRHSKTKNEAGAVFSGDPINSGEMKGRAAQLIDLYPSKLLAQGVRYAIWNILCYSRITFSEAEDVFAALQWGKDPQSGNLFEPSRCQLSFPLKSKHYTKYVCLIDLEKRELVYLDANLHGQTSFAGQNGESLSKNMPAFMEYIRSLPSVHDLFRESVISTGSSESNMHILYSDKDAELKDVPAYVFKPENKNSKYNPVDINGLL